MMPHIARTHKSYYGLSAGNGHCVALVRECAGLPHTRRWRRGEPVRGGNYPAGTVIGTFDDDGRYGNHIDGRSHCAILLAEHEDGLLVCDQWVGQKCQERILSWRGWGKSANDGCAFYTIELADDGPG